VISRARPALPLARLRARGELAEVRGADLRFSRTQTRALLTDVLGLRLSGSEVVDFTGPHEHLVEYLAAEVLSALPEDLRDFVLRTSVLERLSAELCDAVTGRDDSGAMLEEAGEQSGWTRGSPPPG
jgi:LuxR family transcriptional regulator, maltose regulon positive regulatory protein